jgi:hypothetical protein
VVQEYEVYYDDIHSAGIYYEINAEKQVNAYFNGTAPYDVGNGADPECQKSLINFPELGADADTNSEDDNEDGTRKLTVREKRKKQLKELLRPGGDYDKRVAGRKKVVDAFKE